MMKLGLVLAVAVFAAGLSACGEKVQVTVYQQGKYQGKPDTQPWDNDRFKNDEVAWEKAIKGRNSGQNENVRLGVQ
jgi:hypothetical protein